MSAVAVAVVVDNGEPEKSGCNPHYSGPLKMTVLIALFIEVAWCCMTGMYALAWTAINVEFNPTTCTELENRGESLMAKYCRDIYATVFMAIGPQYVILCILCIVSLSNIGCGCCCKPSNGSAGPALIMNLVFLGIGVLISFVMIYGVTELNVLLEEYHKKNSNAGTCTGDGAPYGPDCGERSSGGSWCTNDYDDNGLPDCTWTAAEWQTPIFGWYVVFLVIITRLVAAFFSFKEGFMGKTPTDAG